MVMALVVGIIVNQAEEEEYDEEKDRDAREKNY